jgi:hypothetical protein
VWLQWTPSAIDAGHRWVLARASLLIPPDTYANGTIFDVVGDRHVGQRNIHVLAMGAQKNMLFPFLVTNGLWEQGEFTVFARELRERREIEPVLRALGWGGVQLGETPLPEVEFAPLRPLKETDDGAVLAAGGAHRLWFDPRDTKPAGPLAGRLRLSMKQGDVVPAVAAIERNPRARAGDVNVVAVHQLGPRGNLGGGLTLVVVH